MAHPPVQCEVCGKAPRDGFTVYRTGETGPDHDPHWRCDAHRGDAVIPEEVLELTAVIEQGLNNPSHH